MSEYLRPAFAVVLPNLIGISGSVFMTTSVRTWFKNLNRPSWGPPNGVFVTAWTYLYCTMGYASYLVWRDGSGFGGEARLPLAIYGTQLVLNWIWSPIFFKFKKLGLATIEIGVLWGAIAGTIYTFYPVNKVASYLLLPYLAWVSLATSINYYIWTNNKDRRD